MQNILNHVDTEVIEVLHILTTNNYQAYIVGGAVRDIIMNRKVNDFDISTSALPNETVKIFKELGYEVKTQGIKHGTVEVIYKKHYMEITTFRTDGEYLDNRHPKNVVFTISFKTDAARRDFTINAIGLDENGKLYDYYKGIDDIQLQVIRTVGNPIKRFAEDSLRILRAIRFSATLGFSIEANTKKAMLANFHNLDSIALERIYQEISGIFKGEYFSMICPYLPIIAYIMKSDEISDNIINFSDYEQRLAYALRNKKNLNDVYLSNTEKNDILAFYEYQNDEFNDYKIKLLINQYGYMLTQSILSYNIIINHKNDEYIKRLEQLKDTCCTIKQLAINGNDLINLGFKGKEISDILNKLLEKIMKKELENKKAALLKAAKNYYKVS